MLVLCVFLEITIPNVNTLPEPASDNDGGKVYKDPWVMMAAWHCAACQVRTFYSSSWWEIQGTLFGEKHLKIFAHNPLEDQIHFKSQFPPQILLYFHLPTLAPFAARALGEDVIWTGLALLVNTSTIIISAPPLGNNWNAALHGNVTKCHFWITHPNNFIIFYILTYFVQAGLSTSSTPTSS